MSKGDCEDEIAPKGLDRPCIVRAGGFVVRRCRPRSGNGLFFLPQFIRSAEWREPGPLYRSVRRSWGPATNGKPEQAGQQSVYEHSVWKSHRESKWQCSRLYPGSTQELSLR